MGRSRPIGNTWVTDMRHYLGGSGPALNLALFLRAPAAWVTSGRSVLEPRTNVTCWRSPERRRCRGEILASFEDGGLTITW